MGYLLIIFSFILVAFALAVYWTFIAFGIVLLIIYGAGFVLGMVITGSKILAMVIGCMAVVGACYWYYRAIS